MPSILIIDDQPCVRALLSEELTADGYRVEGLGDGDSVRTHLESTRPDLVLLDLYLDGSDGWELLRDIKRQDPELPVLIVTAYDSFVDDPRLSEADGYFVKSLDFMDLKQKIAHLLREKPSLETKVEADRHVGNWRVADLPC